MSYLILNKEFQKWILRIVSFPWIAAVIPLLALKKVKACNLLK
jgi:hypothetical protein